MKIQTKFGTVIAALLLFLLSFLSSTLPAAAEEQYNIQAHWVLGPVRSDPTTAEWTSWARYLVGKLYNDGTLKDRDVGHSLLPEYIIQQRSSLQFFQLQMVIRISRKAGGPQISMDQIRFRGTSSDPANSLKSSVNWGAGDYIYTPEVIGVTWDPKGPRVNDKIERAGSGKVKVDEIVGVGLITPYYLFSTEKERIQAFDYVEGNELAISQWIEVMAPDKATVLASATRTLEYAGTIRAPRLAMVKQSGNFILNYEIDPGNTAYLISSPTVNAGPAEWTLEASLNGNGGVSRPTTTGNKFFRLTLEP